MDHKVCIVFARICLEIGNVWYRTIEFNERYFCPLLSVSFHLTPFTDTHTTQLRIASTCVQASFVSGNSIRKCLTMPYCQVENCFLFVLLDIVCLLHQHYAYLEKFCTLQFFPFNVWIIIREISATKLLFSE